jgi:three-Cys-motif partner protein
MGSPSPVSAGPHNAVKRELLVRYLDGWAPAALHGGRQALYVDGYADLASAEAALRVFGEFPDLLARRRLSVTAVPADAVDLAVLSAHLDAVRDDVSGPPGLKARALPGPADEAVAATLAERGPALCFLDAAGRRPPAWATVALALAGGRGEALLAMDATAFTALTGAQATAGDRMFGDDAWRLLGGDTATLDYAHLVECYRDALRRAGAQMVSHVELVDGAGRAELLFFATSSTRGLERFKDELWAVDEYAGVRYRDPRDPGHALLDISLSPHPGPLRRGLLRRLASGPTTLAELRRYALTETVYRTSDVNRVLTAMLNAGAVTRDPNRGRLTAETVIAAASGLGAPVPGRRSGGSTPRPRS